MLYCNIIIIRIMKTNIQMHTILNMMKYFAANTKYCHLLKMMKLIYLSDVKSLRENDDIISGIQFKKWKKGPVADKLYFDLINNRLWSKWGVKIIKEEFNPNIDESPGFSYYFKFKDNDFNDEWFSENQLKIMKDIVFIYKDIRSEDISDITHEKSTINGYPWFNANDDDFIKFEDYLGKELTEEQKIQYEDIFEYNQRIRENEKSKI